MQHLIISGMAARETLVANVDRLCQEKKWKRFHLARAMGVKPESLSRSLNGLPRIDTIERIAKALDVSIKSLFEDPDAIEGFVSDVFITPALPLQPHRYSRLGGPA